MRDDLASDGVRLEAQLRQEAGDAASRPAATSLRDGDLAAARGDRRAAIAAYGAAIGANGRDPQGWLRYARNAAAIEPKDSEERYRLRSRVVTSAYMAYSRATTRPDEAAALDALGAAFAVRETWRMALDAYRTRLDLADSAATRAVYDDLRAKHGFRVTGYEVDSDAAAPRVCFQFSESLAAKIDFAPFVAISGAANGAVTADDQQLCVDGLKHGERYGFVLRQGLPSAVGEDLLRSADYDVYVRDRSPQVRFTGRNYVLPRTGQAGIPVVSVNTPKLDVDVMRIGDRSLLPTLRSDDFLSQLSGPSADAIAKEKGFQVWHGTLDTARAELNQDAVTAFPVLQAVGRLEPGLYIMTARPSGGTAPSADDMGGDDTRATQWFVVSDLGLSAFTGPDGVHVSVRSLSTAEPIAAAEIRLVARNNEVLATRRTDQDGFAAFDPGLARGKGGVAPGLVVATLGEDYGFLDLSSQAFDLGDRGSKGRAATGGPEALLFAERGVYRSGETVYLTALLRDARGAAVPGLPLTMVAKRPDGVEYRRALVADEGLGGRAFAIPLLPAAARGTWRVAAYTDPKGEAVGETSFLVEDYVPERLDLTVTAATPTLAPNQPAAIDVAARFLYGAPGADLDVSGTVTVQLAARVPLKGLEAFTVGIDDESVEPTSAELEEHGRTDDAGRTRMSVPIPAVASPRPLEARIALAVAEDGGRAVSRQVTVPILPAGPVLALRETTGGNLREGSVAAFEVAAARPDGTRLARSAIGWTLFKVTRRYQWYRQNGRWAFEPVKSAQKVREGSVDTDATAFGRIEAPVEYGSYRLEARAPGLQTASLSFTVGWSGDETADVPDLLDVTLDKAAYAAGDTMRVHLTPRFAGKATLAVVSDKVETLRAIDLPASGVTVDVPVRAEWGAGAYLVASAYRPLDTAAKRLPGRALGVAWFGLDRAERTLEVKLDAPATIRPRGRLTVPVRLAGLQPGEQARVTLAAVDVGILNLTHYAPPDPFAFFFGQKALATEMRDLYGYLIDGMQGTAGAIRSGGDAGAGAFTDPPPTQEPLARYSGVVTVGPDGRAEIAFDIPAFNGTARLMAVAWTAGRVGSATQDTVIRDPVVLTGTVPRFLSVGDRSRFSVTLDNVEAPPGDYVFDLDFTGPLLVPADALHRVVRLERGGKATLAIPLTAAGAGVARLDVRITGAGLDGSAGQSFALPIQPGTATLVRRTVRAIEPGASVTLGRDLIADILPGTGRVSVSASPLAALDVPALLASLDRYPYGCTEQTVSRALPLLYANRLAALDGIAADDQLDGRIRDAIDRVLARQGSDGSFGLWGVGGDDLWLDAYTADFLTRARERGFAVPPIAFTIALDRLRNTVANTTEIDKNGPEIAYAAYVLARNGRPVMGDLRYLADTKLSAFATPLARGQIGAALALLGDRTRSQAAFASALDVLQRGARSTDYRADYGSRLRDGAALLALSGEADAGGGAAPFRPIAAVLTQERQSGRALSTQEEAWMVLAAQSLTRDADAMAFSVDGRDRRGALYRSWAGAAIDSREVTIANRGRAAAELVVSVSGNPIGPEPAIDRGYAIERSAFKLDGAPVDLSSVRQNDRIAIVLKVTEAQARGAKLMLVDRLPAGFEIENPKLADADAFSELAMLKSDVQPDHTEFRDDRFVATYNRAPGQSAFFTVGYVVRAVSPGRYVQPAATVEDMYRPERFGRTAFGTVEVAPAPAVMRLLVVGAGLAAAATVAAGVALWRYADTLPPLDLAAAAARSTVVLDRDGRLLRPFAIADGRWRLPVEPAAVDGRYLAMLRAYEDKRFGLHPGIDPLSLARAGWQWLAAGRVVSGGSTLSMQVARLVEPRGERSLGAKFRQAVRAVQLERQLGHEGVLRLYLALAPFGGPVEGVRAASLAYFGREPNRLTAAEAALLVALPQAPEGRRPDRHPAAARQARARVLARAVAAGIVSPDEADAAEREPVPTGRRPFPMLAAHAAGDAVAEAPGVAVHRLAIDARWQASLEALARDAVGRSPGLSAAVLVVDNRSGEVRARVGSAGYLDDTRAGAIDMTRAVRSPGSALKPFVYSLAFDNGVAHPETLIEDRPARFGGTYAPENFDLSYQGTVTARRALQLSLNIPAVEMLDAVGAARFVAILRGAGAAIALPRETAPGLPVVLGGLGISLTDLARLYAGFAREGSVPALVWRLDRPRPDLPERRVAEPVSAWYVADILRGAPPPENALAGRLAYKTGTSYGYRDAWAVGFDRRFTVAVWVGRPDGAPVPGLVGRLRAAPILFDAFARIGGEPEAIPAPPGVLLRSNGQLPPPLRRLRKDGPRGATASADQPLHIAYPPDGARIDLGLVDRSDRDADLALKATGGRPPLVWIVNNAPLASVERRQAAWRPDGAGFVRISVMDAGGATDSVLVRLE